MGFSSGKIVFFLVFIVLIGEILFLGFVANKSTPTRTHAEIVQGPLKLSVDLNKTVYKLGESINITLTLTNISNKTIYVGFSNPPELDFTIYDGAGQKIYSYSQSHVWPMILVGQTLAPNASYSSRYVSGTIVWNLKESPTYYDPAQVFMVVKPGTYFISGRTGDLIEFKMIETPKIQIKIES